MMHPFVTVKKQRGVFMKKSFIALLAFLLLLSACGSREPEIQTGWRSDPQGVFYLDDSAAPLTGWQSIDGNCYYFHPDRGGAMVTGWLELPRGRYYFDSNGVMQTGWLELSGKRYYMRPDGPMAVGTVYIDGVPHHFTSAGEPFLLVNHNHPLPKDFQPELTELEGFRVAAECAGPLLDMLEACRAAGHRCIINSAYRDIAFQQMLWDNRYQNYIAQGYSEKDAAELTSQIVLPPGTSEHHTGLAVDISGTEAMYSWLAVHAPEYGFILRYPQDKTQWTGIIYEPWHFRYVGRELAQELQALQLTPEEYLYQFTEIP